MGLDIFESIEGVEGYGDSLFSRMIKAGHRTYFVDVKTTRQQDYFLSLTELRKKITPNGVVNERNKVFIYQEDFDKLGEALKEALAFIDSNKITKTEE
jgi:thymidylate kinase